MKVMQVMALVEVGGLAQVVVLEVGLGLAVLPMVALEVE